MLGISGFVFVFAILKHGGREEQERGAYHWSSARTGFYQGTKCLVIEVQARPAESRVESSLGSLTIPGPLSGSCEDDSRDGGRALQLHAPENYWKLQLRLQR